MAEKSAKICGLGACGGLASDISVSDLIHPFKQRAANCIEHRCPAEMTEKLVKKLVVVASRAAAPFVKPAPRPCRTLHTTALSVKTCI